MACKDCVNIFKREKPYINLLDIHLPGRNGFELLKCQRLREGFASVDDDKPGR